MKLDRTAFHMNKLEIQANHTDYWLSKTVKERLIASWYLTCSAYNLDFKKNHRLDKSAFKMSKIDG